MWLMLLFVLNANTQTNALQVIGGNRTVVQGRTVTFTCKLVDATEPLSQITWQMTTRVKKNKDFLTVLKTNGPEYINGHNDRIEFIGSFHELNGSVRISNVSLLDEGIYTCIFTLFPSGNHNTDIHLDVLVPPVNLVKDNLPTLGDKEVCIVTCTAAGAKPPANVSWLTGSLAGILRATANSTHHDNGTTTTVSYLFGVPTMRINQQVVQCVVTSPALSNGTKIPFTIQVYFAPKEVKIGANPEEDSFECVTDSNPKAEFNWTRVDQAWPQSGVRVEGGTLKFLTRSSDLNGLYKCTASNLHGRSNVYIFRSVIPGFLQGIVHPKMKLYSLSTHHYANGESVEVFESTKNISGVSEVNFVAAKSDAIEVTESCIVCWILLSLLIVIVIVAAAVWLVYKSGKLPFLGSREVPDADRELAEPF